MNPKRSDDTTGIGHSAARLARYGFSGSLLLLLNACVTVPPFQPTPNPDAHKYWPYQLHIEPPLPAQEVRVDVLYTAGKATCPVSEVGLQIHPHQQGDALRFDVPMDQFNDDECNWRAHQLWIGLGQESGYTTRFSLPIDSDLQARWCRLNPAHGACMANQSDIRAYNIPGSVHRVTVVRGQ